MMGVGFEKECCRLSLGSANSSQAIPFSWAASLNFSNNSVFASFAFGTAPVELGVEGEAVRF